MGSSRVSREPLRTPPATEIQFSETRSNPRTQTAWSITRRQKVKIQRTNPTFECRRTRYYVDNRNLPSIRSDSVRYASCVTPHPTPGRNTLATLNPLPPRPFEITICDLKRSNSAFVIWKTHPNGKVAPNAMSEPGAVATGSQPNHPFSPRAHHSRHPQRYILVPRF
jgi:hypothetical protein